MQSFLPKEERQVIFLFSVVVAQSDLKSLRLMQLA